MAIKNINIEEMKVQINNDSEIIKLQILAALCKVKSVAAAVAAIPEETLVEVAVATSGVVRAYGEVALAILPAVEAILSVVAPEEVVAEEEPIAQTSQPFTVAEEKIEVAIGDDLVSMTQEEFKDYSFRMNSL